MISTADRVLDPGTVDALYEVYLSAFEPLRMEAAARHLLTFAEFSAEMVDERIEKLIVWDENTMPVGLATLTQDLSAIPWISPEYYSSRYADAARRGAIFYLGYILVAQSGRRSSALLTLTDKINRRLYDAKGVLGFDLCGLNDREGIGRLALKLLGASNDIKLVDTQFYYAADYQ